MENTSDNPKHFDDALDAVSKNKFKTGFINILDGYKNGRHSLEIIYRIIHEAHSSVAMSETFTKEQVKDKLQETINEWCSPDDIKSFDYLQRRNDWIDNFLSGENKDVQAPEVEQEPLQVLKYFLVPQQKLAETLTMLDGLGFQWKNEYNMGEAVSKYFYIVTERDYGSMTPVLIVEMWKDYKFIKTTTDRLAPYRQK